MPKLEVVPGLTDDNWQSQDMVDWLDGVEAQRRWLIPELLPAESLVLMSGQQKLTQKTFTALAALLTIVTGKEMSLLSPTETGTVLGVEEEGAAAETKARIIALCNALGIKPKQLKSKFGWAFRQGVLLNDEKWQERLLRETERLKPKLVMFDAMFALHTANENDAGEMAPIIHFFNKLRGVCGSTILILAHLNESHGWNPRADIDRQVRGSGILPQAVDLHLALRRYDEKDTSIKLQMRARGAAPKHYSVQWVFDTDVQEDGTSLLKAAHISMAPTDGQRSAGRAVTFKPEQGKHYTQAYLRKVFEGDLKRAKAFAQQALQDGVFKIIGDDKWECVK